MWKKTGTVLRIELDAPKLEKLSHAHFWRTLHSMDDGMETPTATVNANYDDSHPHLCQAKSNCSWNMEGKVEWARRLPACLPAILLVGVSEPSPLFSQLPYKKRSFSEGLNKYILQIVFLISFYLFVFGSGPLFIFQTVWSRKLALIPLRHTYTASWRLQSRAKGGSTTNCAAL